MSTVTYQPGIKFIKNNKHTIITTYIGRTGKDHHITNHPSMISHWHNTTGDGFYNPYRPNEEKNVPAIEITETDVENKNSSNNINYVLCSIEHYENLSQTWGILIDPNVLNFEKLARDPSLDYRENYDNAYYFEHEYVESPTNKHYSSEAYKSLAFAIINYENELN